MKVIQEKLPASQIGLEVEIPAETSKNTYEKVVKELARSTTIPGFRRGKIPRPILLQRLGHQRVKAAVLEELIQDSLKQAIEQESLETIGNYQLRSKFEELLEEYKPGEAIIFQAAVDVQPEVTLGQYQGLTVKAEEVVYDPKQVDELLEERRTRLATLVPIEERAAQMGDVAVVDFQGRKPAANEGEEGELIPGAEGNDFQVELGEGRFIPGFVEAIAGMNLDETKQVHLNFPEDYPQENLAGQPVVFTITLKEIKEKELPELDDDFAQEVSEFETMAELRESLEKQYQQKAANETKNNIHAAIVEELRKHTSVEIPETMIQEEVQNLLLQTASQMQNYGMDISKIFTRETVPQMREHSRPEAVKNLQTSLIIQQIAQQESINIEPEALAERLAKVKANLKDKDIDEEKLQTLVLNELVAEKTLDWLQERTNVELVPEGSLSQSSAENEGEGEATTAEENSSETE
jgi:trigger factor